MELEKRVNEAWQAVKKALAQGPGPDLAEAEEKFFRILNVPATFFNRSTLTKFVEQEDGINGFLRYSDRYPPSMDLETEEAFVSYFDLYLKARKQLFALDAVAWFQGPMDEASEQAMLRFFTGELGFSELCLKFKKKKKA